MMAYRPTFARRAAAYVICWTCLFSASAATADKTAPLDAKQLAQSVTIYRDGFGVPHIDGPTDESVVFGFAYAQAEDFFCAS